MNDALHNNIRELTLQHTRDIGVMRQELQSYFPMRRISGLPPRNTVSSLLSFRCLAGASALCKAASLAAEGCLNCHLKGLLSCVLCQVHA